MATTFCVISKDNIERYESVKGDLKDGPKSNFIFRYSTLPGKGSFYLRHWSAKAGKPDKWVKLGTWPDISVATAKAALKVEMRKFSLGTQCNEHVGEVKLNTVADLILWYLKHKDEAGDKKPKNLPNIKSICRHHILARIGSTKLSQLTVYKVHKLIYKTMSQEGYASSTIDQVYIRFRAAFKAAIKVKLLTESPIDDLSVSSIGGVKVLKTGGILTTDMPNVLNIISKKPPETRMLINVLLHFAVRISEAAGAKWSEFDIDNGVWRIPASRVKTKEELVLYFCDDFAVVLKKYKREQMKTGRNSMYLFPQKKNKRKPLSANYGSRKVSLAFKGRYVAHDFRKLARNWWIENGVDFIIGEFILNHKIQGASRNYIFTTAQEKMIEALNAWYDYCYDVGFYREYERMPLLRVA